MSPRWRTRRWTHFVALSFALLGGASSSADAHAGREALVETPTEAPTFGDAEAATSSMEAPAASAAAAADAAPPTNDAARAEAAAPAEAAASAAAPAAASAAASRPPVRSRHRRGGVFSDLYIGAAVTTDATVTLDGVRQEESLLCGAECSSTKSPIGGIRVGWFVGRFPWLGVSGDFSVFIQSWGIQSPYEVSVIPISALLMLRAPLVRSPEHPNGRAQPYLAIGPSLVMSRAKLAEGVAALGTARVETDTAVEPGLDARVGIRLIASSWISVILEYRATYFKPTWNLKGRRVATSVWTNHFIIGLGIHY